MGVERVTRRAAGDNGRRARGMVEIAGVLRTPDARSIGGWCRLVAGHGLPRLIAVDLAHDARQRMRGEQQHEHDGGGATTHIVSIQGRAARPPALVAGGKIAELEKRRLAPVARPPSAGRTNRSRRVNTSCASSLRPLVFHAPWPIRAARSAAPQAVVCQPMKDLRWPFVSASVRSPFLRCSVLRGLLRARRALLSL